jgi:antitoxin component YwqK of YwqJK toxin-antitoxin module
MNMCPQEHTYTSSVSLSKRAKGFKNPKTVALTLLILVFINISCLAFAQNRSEDYLLAKNWILPNNAIEFHDLKLEKDLHIYQDKPFTGLAYERFASEQLSRAVSYVNGKQDGLMLLWYPDGAPQMSAYYRDGMLNGRFLGWYQNGGVIYDMVLNRGAYMGDNVTHADDGQDDAGSESPEGEGRDNDKSSD